MHAGIEKSALGRQGETKRLQLFSQFQAMLAIQLGGLFGKLERLHRSLGLGRWDRRRGLRAKRAALRPWLLSQRQGRELGP